MAKRGGGGKRSNAEAKTGGEGGGAAPRGGFLDRSDAPEAPEAPGLTVGDVDTAILTEHGDAETAELVASAAAAEAEYDYDAALQLLRLAVRKSGGDREALQALARFLVESYALYDEAVTLLESPAAHAAGDPILRRLLADALFQCGRGAAALPLYEAGIRARGEDDPDAALWLRVGALREEAGDDAAALEAFREAQRLDPGSRAAAQHLAAIQDRAAGASAERMAEARAALSAGDTSRARAIAEELLAGPGDHREPAALLREIEGRERAARLAELVAAAREAGEAAGPDEALDRWREVLAVEPEHPEAREAIPRLEHAIALRHFEDRLARGSAAVADGRLADAIHAFYRAQAVRPADTRAPADLPGRHLYDLTSEFLAEVGARQLDRVAPALAALCHAEQAIEQADLVRAESLVREAAPALGSFRRLDALRDRLQEHDRERARERARVAYEEARTHEEAGDAAAAIEAFDRAASLAGGSFDDAGERAAALRAALRRQEDVRRLRGQLQRLAEESRWFELRRAIDASASPDDAEVASLRARAEDAIAAEFPTAVTPPPFVPEEEWGRCLDSRGHGLPDLDRTGTRVLRSPDGSRLLVMSGPLLVVVDTSRLTARLVADVSPGVSFGMKGELVLATDHPRGGLRIVLVSEKEGHLLDLHATDAGVSVRDRHDLGPILPAQRDRTLRYYALHAPSERLVQLETRRNSNGPTTLRNLSLADGRVVHDEHYNYGLWNLVPYPHSDRFVVNRVVDFARRLRSGYFTFALVDHRGRFVRRVNLPPEDVPEPMERIHSIARSERLDRLYLTYDYYDPLGNVVRNYPALMVLRGESEVYYQSPAPEKLLSGKRLPKGTLRLIEPEEGDPLLVLPHSDADGRTGISVLGADDLKHRFELELEEGETLHSLHEVEDGRGLVAFTFPFGDGAWRLRRLDPEAGAWRE